VGGTQPTYEENGFQKIVKVAGGSKVGRGGVRGVLHNAKKIAEVNHGVGGGAIEHTMELSGERPASRGKAFAKKFQRETKTTVNARWGKKGGGQNTQKKGEVQSQTSEGTARGGEKKRKNQRDCVERDRRERLSGGNIVGEGTEKEVGELPK